MKRARLKNAMPLHFGRATSQKNRSSNMIIRDENYYTISAWMNTKLKLSGQALHIFAIIFAFSQNGQSEFHGSLRYIAELTGIGDRANVCRVLNKLVKDGLICRREENHNSVKSVFYSVNFDKIDELKRCCQNDNSVVKTTTGCCQNDNRGVFKTTTGCCHYDNTYIKDDIKDNIQDDNKESHADGVCVSSEQLKKEFLELWKLYPRQVGEGDALKAYIEARRKGVTFDAVKQGIEGYASYIGKKNIDVRYVKYGSTWFEENGWNDKYGEIENVKYKGNSNFENSSFDVKTAFDKALARARKLCGMEDVKK